MKRFLLSFLFLLLIEPAWAATPDNLAKARSSSVRKEPYVILLAVDPTDPNKLIKILIDPSGAIVTTASGPVTTLSDQGASGVLTDPWFQTLSRRSDGAEFGLAATPLGVSLFDGGSNLLGVAASPLFMNIHQIAGNAIATGAGNVDTGTQRVTLADDQADVPIDTKKLNGNTISVGSGSADTGTQRMTLADDQAPVTIASPDLESVDTNTLGLNNTVDGNEQQVDVVTLPSVLVADANNTTSTPLGSGATFTGTATDLLAVGNPQIIVSVFADQDSATDGLVLQFSQDGTNWPAGSYKQTFTLDANVARSFPLGPGAQFFRVVLTNGGTGQATLRLTTLLQRNIGHDPLHRVLDTVDGDRSVKLSKSVLFAQKPDLSFANVDMTAAGNLKFALEEIDAGALPLPVSGTDADGANPTENPVLMAGQDGTDVQSLKTDSDGELQIDVVTAPLPIGAPIKDHKAVVVGTGPTLILVADANRSFATVCNADNTLVAIGNSDVTLNSTLATDGLVLKVSGIADGSDGTNGCYDDETTSAIYGSGTDAGSKVIVLWGTR